MVSEEDFVAFFETCKKPEGLDKASLQRKFHHLHQCRRKQ